MRKLLSIAIVALSAGTAMIGQAADVKAGKAAADKYNCFSCHGKDYNTPVDPSYPKLAGQHADYLEVSMLAYQRGGDGANGRANAIMAAQVKPLSRQDIKNIAAYLESLPGTLVTRR